jgi:serine phosphatase RsbU (regulator of sigma subunit)/Tfp pilus assembly protein PilF
LLAISFEYNYIDPVKGLEYAKQALELSRKLHDKNEEAGCIAMIGSCYRFMKDFDKSLEYSGIALKMDEEMHNDSAISWDLKNIGNTYSQMGKFDLGIVYLNRAIKIDEKLKDYKSVAAGYSNLAYIYARKGEYRNAILYFNSAKEYFEKTGNELLQAYMMVNIGGTYHRQGDEKIALTILKKALKIYEKQGKDINHALTFFNLGQVYTNLADYPNAIDSYLKALRMYEEFRINDKINMILNNIANIYINLSDYSKAKEYLDKAMTIAVDAGDSSLVHYTSTSMGKYYYDQGGFKKAMTFYIRANKILERQGSKRHKAANYQNIGNTYKKLGNYNAAIEYYKKAIDTASVSGDKPTLASCFYSIGNCYNVFATDTSGLIPEKNLPRYKNQQDNLDKALESLKSALVLFRELGNIDQERLVLNDIYEVYMKKGDYKKALEYHLNSVALKDSIFNFENNQKIANLESKHETEIKEKELLIYKAINKQQETIIISGAGGLVILIVLVFVILRSLRNKRNANLLLEQKNSLITKQKEDLELSNNIIQSDIQQAMDYVTSLLPGKMKNDKLVTDWLYIPSSQLGGDAFGYHWIDNDHFAFYILDVCGHGIGSALHSISVLHFIRQGSQLAIDNRDPAMVLKALNNSFQSENHNGMFFTMWYGVYNWIDKTLTYTCAGHPAPLLIHKDGSTQLLDPPLPTVGIMEDAVYSSKKIEIPDIVSIYLFSDGVYEIKKNNGETMLNSEFTGLLKNHHTKENNDLTGVFETLSSIQGSREFEDDFSIVNINISA